MTKKPSRFGDLVPGQLDVESWVDVEEIIDKDLMIEDFQERTGQHGPFFAIRATDPKTKISIGFSCGSEVVMRKIREAKAQGYLPLTGKIVKVKSGSGMTYYDIV